MKTDSIYCLYTMTVNTIKEYKFDLSDMKFASLLGQYCKPDNENDPPKKISTKELKEACVDYLLEMVIEEFDERDEQFFILTERELTKLMSKARKYIK